MSAGAAAAAPSAWSRRRRRRHRRTTDPIPLAPRPRHIRSMIELVIIVVTLVVLYSSKPDPATFGAFLKAHTNGHDGGNGGGLAASSSSSSGSGRHGGGGGGGGWRARLTQFAQSLSSALAPADPRWEIDDYLFFSLATVFPGSPRAARQLYLGLLGAWWSLITPAAAPPDARGAPSASASYAAAAIEAERQERAYEGLMADAHRARARGDHAAAASRYRAAAGVLGRPTAAPTPTAGTDRAAALESAARMDVAGLPPHQPADRVCAALREAAQTWLAQGHAGPPPGGRGAQRRLTQSAARAAGCLETAADLAARAGGAAARAADLRAALRILESAGGECAARAHTLRGRVADALMASAVGPAPPVAAAPSRALPVAAVLLDGRARGDARQLYEATVAHALASDLLRTSLAPLVERAALAALPEPRALQGVAALAARADGAAARVPWLAGVVAALAADDRAHAIALIRAHGVLERTTPGSWMAYQVALTLQDWDARSHSIC
ncbi:hypothetical protein CXG81DRAFT_19247 [Caulochytrium protostelioides]|uniref:Uncharacterized protein n=1 Tax=Caulochytrium protostelioides TaxID=1555241 RepID=A0A4V1IUK6_9FUNG|nr:hypothetical protein CXG81DRAFT_19247 [Caulochytrium protostelioides]|eukprot:RKP00889.1 hypothetical protein CXG81DRAFT_19247 [Caulochytrium protostelioides]